MTGGTVWYLAYGSNLSRARFLCYLQGGVPPGSTGARQAPAGDPRPPRADRPVTVPGRLWFAHRSASWQHGGVAFADLDAAGRLLCRAWLITEEQFDDLFAAENGEPAQPLGAASMAPGETRDAGGGWYRRLRCVGAGREAPVVTFTSPEPLGALAPARPSAAYLSTLADGLAAAHGMGVADAVDYLTGCPGADAWDPAALCLALRGGRPGWHPAPRRYGR